MSSVKNDIPTIAITPDEGPSNNEETANDYEEVLTDVEDLYVQTEKRKKKSKKCSPKRDAYLTDVETIDASDDDISPVVIKHSKPISVEEILEREIPFIEEVSKVNNERKKPKLRTQSSLTSNDVKTLKVELEETNESITDVENFCATDEEPDLSDNETSDTDLLKEIINDSGTIAISDNVKKFLQAGSSSTRRNDPSGNNEKRMKSNLSDLSDLTETEYLSCDIKKHKHKHENRRHTLPRKMKLDLTDIEDLEISDTEHVKLRRKTFADFRTSSVEQIDFNSLIAKENNDKSNDILKNSNNLNSDEELPEVLNKKRNSKQYLKIYDHSPEPTTDVEEFVGDEQFKTVYDSDDDLKADKFDYDCEFNNVILKEQPIEKIRSNKFKVREPFILKPTKKEFSKELQDETDEEECESEIYEDDVEKYDKTDNFKIKFVDKVTNKMKKDLKTPKNTNYLVSSASNDLILTDVENLDSSDDDIKKDIPITIVDNLMKQDTDTESIEGEIDLNNHKDISDKYLPSCSRKIIHEKVNKNNKINTVSESYKEEYSNSSVNTSDAETDMDYVSGDDISEKSIEINFDLNKCIFNENDIKFKETLKVSLKESLTDNETDLEEINTELKPNIRRNNYNFIQITEDDFGKLTDVEDLVLSDTENINHQMLSTQNVIFDGITDVEDFYVSDNDQGQIELERFKTPDILKDMEGETICSQEGSGHFSKQERTRLNEKHKSISIIVASPSPTYTDEILTSADDENYSRAETVTPQQVREDLDEASLFKIHSQNIKKIDLNSEEVMYLKGGGYLTEPLTDTDELGVSDEEYFLANDKSDDIFPHNKVFFNDEKKYKVGIEIEHEGTFISSLPVITLCSSKHLLKLEKIYKIGLPLSLVVNCLEITNNEIGFKSKVSLTKIISVYISTMYCYSYLKTIVIKPKPMYSTVIDFGYMNTDSYKKSKQLDSSDNEQILNSSDIETLKMPYFIRLRRGSVKKIITQYEHQPSVERKISPTLSINTIKEDAKLRNIGRNSVLEKTKYFETLPKTPIKRRSDSEIIPFNNKEWDSPKEIPPEAQKSPAETVGAKDAALQDSREVDCFTGNQRHLDTSYSKLHSQKLSHPQLSSYSQLDKILDYMLAEVDKQEMLVQLDKSETSLTPVCVNSLKLVPSTDAVIEIPVSNIKSPKVYETKHEIMLQGETNDFDDLDDEMSLSTLNKSQDTESLFSFESISETYFLDNISNNYKASSESLNDVDLVNTQSNSTADEHLYEIVEPKCITIEHDNKQDIWWEGVYRDLSIVPEEDEDNISEVIDPKSRFKYLSEQNLNILPLQVNAVESIGNYLNDENYDNVSHHSSSDVSQTTGDDCDTSDMEHNIASVKPVKAEIKLLVKTLDNGKEDIEVRNVREFTERVEDIRKKYPSKIPVSKFSKRDESKRVKTKPSYILQRLFVRCPDGSVSKDLSNTYPELVASSNLQYPLQFDPGSTKTRHFKNVDLYANTPFYPCYETYSIPSEFPTAYCDWFLQPEDPNGGITTSPSKHLDNSQVHDTLSKNLKSIVDETESLIKVESQFESPNVCINANENVVGQEKIPEISDKANKELDNKKEKSKSSSKGFFSSLKSLVGRSVDSSDSEAKDEKSPKKKKKEKRTPKKSKKHAKDEKIEEIIVSKETSKPKQPSPKLEKKTKALYDSNEIDNIPIIDEIDSVNGIQVTDLDAEPIILDDLKLKATTFVDNVINDSQHTASKLLDDKMQEFNLEGTVTPEEIRKSTEPIIINEDEFLVVIEPKMKDEFSDTEKFEKSEDDGKTDTLKSRKSVGFLKLFSKKDSKESDDETRIEEQKIVGKPDTEKHDEHRKSVGFFGLFSKKSKEEEPVIGEVHIEKSTQVLKEDEGKKIISEEVQQQMLDTSHFLLREIELFEDVRPSYINKLEAKSPEEDKEVSIKISEEVQQQIVDSAHFITKEVELFDDVMPQKVVEEPCIKAELVPKEESDVTIKYIACSEEIQKQIIDTADFLSTEKELFEDVKINYKVEPEIVEPKQIKISDEVQQQIVDTANFLYTEVEYFNDVKPRFPLLEENTIETVLEPEKTTLPTLQSEEADKNVEKILSKPVEQISKTEDVKIQEKIKPDVEHTESKPGFFSKIGEKFGGKSVEKRDDVKEKKQKKKKDKKPGFFSKIGERFSGTLSDEEREKKEKKLQSEVKLVSETITQPIDTLSSDIIEETNKTIEKIEMLDNELSNIKESKESGKEQLKETISNVKDDLQKEEDKVKSTAEDIQSTTKKETEKIGGFFSDLGGQIKHSVTETKDKIQENIGEIKEKTTTVTQKGVENVQSTSKTLNDKFVDTIQNSEDQFKKSTQDMKDTIKDDITKESEEIREKTQSFRDETFGLAQSGVEKVKDSSEKTKESIKDGVAKISSGFMAGKEKIQDKKQDIQEKAIDLTQNGVDKIKDTSGKAKEAVKEGFENISTGIATGKDKIKDKTQDIQEKVSDLTQSGVEKIEDTSEKAKGAIKDGVTKISSSITIGKDKIQKGTEDVKDKTIELTQSGIEQIQDTSEKAKETVEDSVTKISSGIAIGKDKIQKGTKDITDKTIDLTQSGIEQIKDVSGKAKETVEDGVGKISSGIVLGKDKIQQGTEDIKAKTVDLTQRGIEQIKDTSEKVKDTLEDDITKVSSGVAVGKEKIQETSHDIQKKTSDLAQSGAVKVKDSSKKAKEALTDGLASISFGFAKGKDKIQDKTQDIQEKTTDFTHSGLEKIKDISENVKGAFQDKVDEFSSDVITAKSKVYDTTQHIKDETCDLAQSGVEKIKDTSEKVKETVKDDITKISSGIVEGKVQIQKGTESFKDKTVDLTQSGVKKVKDSSEKTKETVKDGIAKISSGFIAGKEKIKEKKEDIQEKAIDFTQSEVEKIKDTSEKAKETVTDGFANISTDISKGIDKIKDKTQDIQEKTSDLTQSGVEKVKDTSEKTKKAVKDDVEKIQTGMEDIKDKTVELTHSGIEQIRDTSKKATETVEDGVAKVNLGIATGKEKIKKGTQDIKDKTVDITQSGIEQIKDTSQKAKETVKDGFEKISLGFVTEKDKIQEKKRDVQDKASAVAQSGVKKIQDASGYVKETFEDGVDEINSDITAAKGKIQEKSQHVKDKTFDLTQSGVDNMKDFSEKSKETIKDGIAKIGLGITKGKDKIEKKTHDIQDKAIDLTQTGFDKTKDASGKIEETFKDGVDEIRSDITVAKSKIQETAHHIKDTTSDLTKSGVEKIKDSTGKVEETVKDGVTKIGSGIAIGKDKIQKGTKDIKDKTVDLTHSGIEQIKDTSEKTKETVQEEVAKISSDFATKKEMMQEKTEDVKDKTSDLLLKGATKMENVLIGIQEDSRRTKEDIKKEGAVLKDKLSDTLHYTAEQSKEGFDDFKDKTKDTFSTIEKESDVLKKKIKETIVNITDEGKDKVKDEFSKVSDNITAKKEKVQESTQNMKENATVLALSGIEKMKDGFDGIKGTIANTSQDMKQEVDVLVEKGSEKLQTADAKIEEEKNDLLSKTDMFFGDVRNKIQDKVKTTEENIVSKKEVGEEKLLDIFGTVKETASDANIALKDGVKSATDLETEKISNIVSYEKESPVESPEKIGFFSNLGKIIKGATKQSHEDLKKSKELLEKSTSDADEKLKEEIDKTKEMVSDIKQEGEEIIQSSNKEVENVKDETTKLAEKTSTLKEDVISAKDSGQKKAKKVKTEIDDNIKEAADKSTGFFSSFLKKGKDTSKDIKDEIVKAKERVAEDVDNTCIKVKESSQKVQHAMESTKDDTINEASKQKDEVEKHIKLYKESEESLMQNIGDNTKDICAKSNDKMDNIIDESTKEVDEKLNLFDSKAIESDTKVKCDKVKKSSDKLKEISIAVIETIDKLTENVKDEVEETQINEKDLKDFGTSVKDSVLSKEKKIKHAVGIGSAPPVTLNLDDEKSKIISDGTCEFFTSLGNKSSGYKSAISPNDDTTDKKKIDFVCYVTTPTMQRKGIGGSQRLTKDERPALMDVSNMPLDISSDEDEYIVTEPGDTPGKHIDDSDSRDSSVVIETIPELDEKEIKDEKLSPDETKRRPLFHIGSRDDDSITESGDKPDKSIHSDEVKLKSDIDVIKTDAQKDIDLIENKLFELGKALDDLEKVDIDLEPQESKTDEKNERKLRRVERRFERMASETMEKDITEAKDKQMTSPEIEEKREEEFRTIVSQLSQEEVSECQKLYSTLWDDVTFTPSEEWDSKTPDSQPDDIQELPQGEVVYMAPVTLNKANLVNKAGIEVDVIPIKHSPCTSPLPKKKLPFKGRARSAMGFYNEKQVEERGSLPDLHKTVKNDDIKFNIQKGSIVSAVLKVQPTLLKDNRPNTSDSSLYSAMFKNDNPFERRKSTESLAKGSVISAVKEWMARSTPFGSIDNIRSNDAISVADTTVSIFDDDDHDSIDMCSDSACQLESECSKSESQIPDIQIFDENLQFYDLHAKHDAFMTAASHVRGVNSTYDDNFPLGEISGGPLTKITTEVSTTNLITQIDAKTELPKPKPRIDKTSDSSKIISQQDSEQLLTKDTEEKSDVVTDDIAYSDKKKFWETVSSSKKEDRPEVLIKKRMSLYEEQISKPDSIIAKKRTSVHEIEILPPVPKPRLTVIAQVPVEDQIQISDKKSEELEKETKIKEVVAEKSPGFISEYKAAFVDHSLISDKSSKLVKTETESKSFISTSTKTIIQDKTESVDSESEYLKFEHPVYDNAGYTIEELEFDEKLSEKSDFIPQIKRRQMSISQVPVAAARKTIFERSVSLPTEDLQDVSEKSVRARKQFFEQQIKNEMVIDQLMTQLEEEESQEYKTLSTKEIPKLKTTEEKIKIGTIPITEKDIEKKLSPISSSSSQDTKTEDDITQYTPTSVKDLSKCFQSNLLMDTTMSKDLKDIQADYFETTNIYDNEIFDSSKIDLSKDDVPEKDVAEPTREILPHLKQSSTESEQSISSERSIEMGSDDIPSQVAEVLQYKSDSISKPSDSLEVHVDKSEIEDSEKVIDIEQDATDVEVKSLGAEEYLSDVAETDDKIEDKEEVQENVEKYVKEVIEIKQHKEEIPDTVWEVSVQSQPATELFESVTEIPIERQIIVEKDEELSGSVRDESDLGSEIHQDHSESYDSERARSESHSEVEQLILESLYHQKIKPDDARKIAAELISDIEAEIERRNLPSYDSEETEPPVPNPEVAKNQISEYLRQLAECKGLDAKEVELVESVLARKQNELSKLGRHDTQTSSMEITDEDLKYSGADNDMSPSESHENILEEQIEQLEYETKLIGLDDKMKISEEKFSEKLSDVKSQDIHIEQDREVFIDDKLTALKTETLGKVETTTGDETHLTKKTEYLVSDKDILDKTSEEKMEMKSEKEKTELETKIEILSDTGKETQEISTVTTDDTSAEHIKKSSSLKKITDTSEIEQVTDEEISKQSICLEGKQDITTSSHEKFEGGFVDKKSIEKMEATGSKDEESITKIEHKQDKTLTDDGTEIIIEEHKEQIQSKTVTTSHIVDHKTEEKTTVTTFIQESEDELLPAFDSDIRQIQSDESKSSPYESAKSLVDQTSTDSSTKKDDSDMSHVFDKVEVVLRKSKLYKDVDTSSSSGNLKADRKSGADFEAYSSSGESHYHSFEQDSGKSRPCSSDVEGLLAAGSSEYESALTSQDVSSRSHITSTEYHTAVSSLSSRESMKSLDSESSGHMASVEVSEASETLVPSTFELEGDIIDGAVSQLLEDELAEPAANELIEPYDREIPEYVIRGEYPLKDKKSSFDTISDSEIHGESMDISEEDSAQDKPTSGEVTSKMKRSQEMTFQPIPKAIIPDSPQSDNALEMDERFGSSLEDGSVLSMSLSSTSDVTALRTVIEASRRDSDKIDGSMTLSGQDSMSASNASLDKIQLIHTSVTDSSTSTAPHGVESLGSVTLTTSTVDENGTQSVCTQVTSQVEVSNEEVYNGPTQVDYVPEYDDVIETKKVRGHRRQESTSTFVPSMIPGFTARTDKFKSSEQIVTESEKITAGELTLKEVSHKETKDVDETEDISEKEIDDEKQTDSTERKLSADRIFSEKILDEITERPTTPDKHIKMSISEKSSLEEGEAEAAFSMVAHVSPAHKAKGDICPILEDVDAEKHELETRERAQKELEKRRAQIIKEQSPGSIPDIMVTEHMTPLVDREFHYPDLELEEKELILQRSAPQTPASISSKSSEDTDQGREYVLDDQVIPEEPELESIAEDKQITETETKSDISHSTTVEEKTVCEAESREPVSATESPNSDSFEMLEKPDIIDDFVVIEEVAKEAAEHDTEGKSVKISQHKYIKKHDEEVEEYLVKSAPTPLTRMTDLKYYPDGNSGDDVGPFDFEDSPPQVAKKSTGTKTEDSSSFRSYAYEYDRELEASKKWIEMQFQGDQAALINAGYGYEMEFERGPLEDIKEEEATDFESSRIGSLDSQKQSIGSLGSVKDSFSSTPEYDVLAGRKFFTRSGDHDDVSMSSLQEFEHLERVISLENRRHHQGSQDSSSNGSFSKRYHASRSGQGDDISISSLKEFEGLESACIEAHKIEVKAKEEEALLTQIDEAQENLISESESCKSISSTDKKPLPESEEEDYEKRMFEIDEIIKQAQSNVEKFVDIKDLVDKTESMGRGDSLEEVAKVPDLELDEPIARSSVHTVKWGDEDLMQTSTDSLDLKPSHHASTDSLDAKTGAVDLMTTSTDSIEYQIQAKSERGMITSDSIEIQDPDKSCMITSDSLELTPGTLGQIGQISDSIDEDGSRIGEPIAHDQSSSSGFSIGRDDPIDIQDQRAEFLLGSTDSLDPSSSTATHATYQYETDSVMSGSFTSGGSNTMVSSTDTIDPLGQAHGVDIATAVRKVWFDDDSFGAHYTTELLDDGSKPFVTEIIEPCEGDPEYSHTIHRKVELPPEIKKITFKGPDADLQLRQYIDNFNEGEDVKETQEVDKDGNVHIKRVVQKRFVVTTDSSGEEKRISGPELEAYLQSVSHPQDDFDTTYKDPSEFGLTKQTRTDSDGTKTIYGQKFTSTYVERQGEESSLKQLLSSIASDVTESSSYTEYKLKHRVDNQQEHPTGSSTSTFSGAAAANVLKAQGSRRKPLRFDISLDDQTEVDPREHDWRFILPQHDEHTPEDKVDDDSKQTTSQQREFADQHQLSTEMKELLEEMEKQSKK